MTLQEFKLEISKEYTKTSKKNVRFYVGLGIFLVAMFLLVTLIMVIGSAKDGISPAFLIVPLMTGIGIAIFLLWCTKRNVQNVHSEFGNIENINVYKAVCTEKRIEQETDGDGQVYDAYYLDYSLGEGFMEGSARINPYYYNNIDLYGECVIVQLGNSVYSRFMSFPVDLYKLDTYDEPNATNQLKRMATTNISVSLEDIPVLKTGWYTFGMIMSIYLAAVFLFSPIIALIFMLADNDSMGARVVLLFIGFVAAGVGMIFAAIACYKAKNSKIQRWFRNLEVGDI